jgi:serine/threonine-protein kinase HipA
MKKAKVYMHKNWAGMLIEDDDGFHFYYEKNYLDREDSEAISLTLPLTSSKYSSKILFPFFDGLIPEGWLLDIVEKNWKLDVRDRMSILLVTCKDCIGAVSIQPLTINNHE